MTADLLDSLPGLGQLSLLYAVLNLIGALLAVRAIMTARSSQAAIAWTISLLTMPLIAVPLFLIFGRRRFNGYLSSHRQHRPELAKLQERLADKLQTRRPDFDNTRFGVLNSLSRLGICSSNQVKLLIDGNETYAHLFAAIDDARDYVLVQSYIVHDDAVGREVAKRLIERTKAGVRVYFMHDQIGSYDLPDSYVSKLTNAGVHVCPFRSSLGRRSRWQINFRNHRKVCVVDGVIAFCGGLNFGCEYRGEGALGHWRDTHLQIRGPAVLAMQKTFAEDFLWSAKTLPDLNWEIPADAGSQSVAIIPTGPVDRVEACNLLFLQLIMMARQRIWIATPYFIPPETIRHALVLAAARGIDVRVILPKTPDKRIAHWAGLPHAQHCARNGVRLYRYRDGFMHQKAIVVDDDFAAIGTANIDNRSFNLNFELTAAVIDADFNREAAAMLEADLSKADAVPEDELASHSFPYRLLVRIANLFSPLL